MLLLLLGKDIYVGGHNLFHGVQPTFLAVHHREYSEQNFIEKRDFSSFWTANYCIILQIIKLFFRDHKKSCLIEKQLKAAEIYEFVPALH